MKQPFRALVLIAAALAVALFLLYTWLLLSSGAWLG